MTARIVVALAVLLFAGEIAQARHHHYVGHADGRPSAWCGWFMRHNSGRPDPGPAYNLARNWAHWGTATGPEPGAIVVWAHHVGMIQSVVGHGRALVLSGNDGNAVRSRVRSISGAIAFRT